MNAGPGIGIDLVRIARFRAAPARSARFLKRVFSDAELSACRRYADPAPHLAARFAAKEAAVKALGAFGISAATESIEVRSLPSGAPTLWRAGRRLRGSVSMTHEGGIAAAIVLLIR